MPRRRRAVKRKILKDPIYHNELVTKLVNRSMRDGKKTVAQKQVYGAFDLIKKAGLDEIGTFSDAIKNIKPSMEVRSRRVGGAAYQIPVPVRGERKESLAIRWLIFAAQARSNSEYHTFSEKLAAEIKDAAKGEGGAVKKRTEMERMAEANRAFAHFRW